MQSNDLGQRPILLRFYLQIH